MLKTIKAALRSRPGPLARDPGCELQGWSLQEPTWAPGGRGLLGSDPAPGRGDSRAREGAGLADRELPFRARGVAARGGGAVGGRGPRPGGPELLAAPPSCPRRVSRGGSGGHQAGSGCAAAALPPRVGECGPGRVSALSKGRSESWTRERVGRPRRGRARGLLGALARGAGSALREPRGAAQGASERRAARGRAGTSSPALGPRCSRGRGGFVRNCVLGLEPRLRQVPGAVGVALRFLVYPE